MIDVFNRLAPKLLAIEQGYVNHPNDRGGPTNFGITERVARKAGYRGDMKALTKQQALAIYQYNYWSAPGFDQVAGYSVPVAEELFDTGVNCGPAVASEILQRSLNVLTKDGALRLDGDIGNKTLAKLRRYLAARPNDGESILLKVLNSLQGERYVRIAESDPTQKDFINGWFAQRVTL